MKWIKVSDKEPHDNQEVLIFAEGQYMWHATYSKKLKSFAEYCPCAGPSGEKATHWVPLPKRPE